MGVSEGLRLVENMTERRGCAKGDISHLHKISARFLLRSVSSIPLKHLKFVSIDRT